MKPSSLVQVGQLTLIAIVLAILTNHVSPRGLPWIAEEANGVADKAAKTGITVVDLAETRRLVANATVMILDARSGADYEHGHIPGALSLPYKDVDTAFADLQFLLQPSDTFLVYCSGHECDESLLLANYLQAQGLTNLLLFAGGYATWSEAENMAGAQP
ncbi:MAG: rhodanese-like domain-containing protein [Verrucomicrobia bacterium]|nr:rhodanese-like domain-containing protein [Verrucomicrobiota bacterium]